MRLEAQGCHWVNSRCTVHPFVVCHKKNDEIIHKSFCFLSPNTKHNTSMHSMAYTFISALMPEIKCFIPELSTIYYFSDDCTEQYKDRFNFINLCFHKMDFGVECEWHFFATSRGKSACYRIGGVVKRMTAKASLQKPFEN